MVFKINFSLLALSSSVTLFLFGIFVYSYKPGNTIRVTSMRTLHKIVAGILVTIAKYFVYIFLFGFGEGYYRDQGGGTINPEALESYNSLISTICFGIWLVLIIVIVARKERGLCITCRAGLVKELKVCPYCGATQPDS